MTTTGYSYDAGLFIYSGGSKGASIINNTFNNCINQGSEYAVIFISGTNYLSGNKFINSTSALKGAIYNTGKMNVVLKFLDNIFTNPPFSLICNVTDDNGNSVSTRYSPVYFYVNGEQLAYSSITNGVAVVNITKLIDNGIYVINGTYENGINHTIIPGTLTVNIDRTPIELWVDSINGNDVAGAGNETNPFKTIGYAINYGSEKSLYPTIHIRNGVYSGVNNTNLVFDKLCVLTLIGESPNNAIINGEGLSPIFSSIGSVSIVTFKNISFVNGKSKNYGGAISSKCVLTVDNCIFKNNTVNEYGGAIYQELNNLTVINSKFINCSSNHYSGAVYFSARYASVIVKNNYFTDCYSNWTGNYNLDYGVCLLYASNAIVSNNQFVNNLANFAGAVDLSVRSYGGSVKNNTFINSSSISSWGALFLESFGGIFNVTNNRFIN